MERQASEIVFQNDGGRIIMSPERRRLENSNKGENPNGEDFPFSLGGLPQIINKDGVYA